MNENEERSNSTLQEYVRTSAELLQLIILFEDKLENTLDIIIEPNLFPDLDRTGFLEEALVDLMVIRLSRLYKIHANVGNVLNKEGDHYRNLFRILSGVWDVIVSNKEKIELWRNSRVVHSEEQSKSYIPIYISDKDHDDTIKKILLSSKLAVWYYQVLYHNAKYLFDVADSFFKIRYGEPGVVYPHQIWKAAEKDEEKIIKEVNDNLKRNGFVDVFKKKH